MSEQERGGHINRHDSHVWRYITAKRDAERLNDADIGQLGHMLDTLKDTTFIMRQIGPMPHLEPELPMTERYYNQRHVPDFIEHYAGDIRSAATFHLTDRAASSERKAMEQPNITAFMNHLHAMMRKNSLMLGKLFVVPEELKADIEAYDALVKRYQELLDTHVNPETKRRDHTCIPQSEKDAFEAAFVPVAERVCDKLEALPEVQVNIDGNTYSIPNHQGPLNKQLQHSCPARVLFVWRSIGAGFADANRRPSEWEYYGRVGNVVGAQSMLSDTVQGFFDLLQAESVPHDSLKLPQDKLERLVQSYGRSFQLAKAFCETVGCGYPSMFGDLDRLITMAGQDQVALFPPQNPNEAALMLYAAERHFARHGGMEDKDRRALRRYTGKIGACESMEAVAQQLGSDKRFDVLLDKLATSTSEQVKDAVEAIRQTTQQVAGERQIG